MTIRYVWSGSASPTSPYADSQGWSQAAHDIPTALGVSSGGDWIYVHTGHSESSSTANIVLTGPANAATDGVIKIISVDKDSSDAYTPATTAQVSITSGSYDIDIDGAFSFHGIYFANSGSGRIDLMQDYDELGYFEDCTFDTSGGTPTYSIFIGSSADIVFKGCTDKRGTGTNGYIYRGSFCGRTTFIDHTSTGTNSGRVLASAGHSKCTFIGCDFSGLASGDVDLVTSYGGEIVFIGCRLPANTDVVDNQGQTLMIYESDTDSGNDQYRTEYRDHEYNGAATVETGTYRTGGATYDGTNEYSLALTHGDADVKNVPTYTPWNTGFLSNIGSKTFTVYIANTTADHDDTEVWLEVEYFSNTGNTLKAIATDRETDPTVAIGSGTAQTDDTTSTWSPAKTYMQELSVTATVNKVGSFRWRVGSFITTDIFVDPAIEIT